MLHKKVKKKGVTSAASNGSMAKKLRGVKIAQGGGKCNSALPNAADASNATRLPAGSASSLTTSASSRRYGFRRTSRPLYINFGEEGYFDPSAVLGKLPSYGFRAVWEGQDAAALQGDPPQGEPGGDGAPQAEDALLALTGASKGSGDTSQGNDAVASGVAYVSPSEGSSDNSIIASDWV